jgi:hypothetical protein
VQTPTYVHIDSFSFHANPAVPDISNSHQITNVWAYYNNNLIGVYDLPVTFPVIANGTGSLSLFASVVENGRNDLVAAYPMYVADTSTLVAQPGSIIHYTPKTTYYNGVQTQILSNFEYGVLNFSQVSNQNGGGNRPIVLETKDVYEGGGAGRIDLLAVGDSSTDSSNFAFEIPLTQSAFIEFNYKSSIPFAVGLQATLSPTISSTQYYLAGINPSDHWQKFYLNVSDFANKAQGTSYYFYIKANLADGQKSGTLLIDNIQLLKF